MAANSLSAVSLFSGAGGMDVGFQAAGFRVEIANDIDPDACETYRRNHGSRIVEGDLREHWGELKHFEGVDILFGGPPCQGFSVAGKMDPQDARSELLGSFFDAVEALRPRAFVCENVKALAVLQKWEGVREGIIARIAKDYLVSMVVLDASDFGVPQRRERVFIIGMRKAGNSLTDGQFQRIVEELLKSQYCDAPTVKSVVTKLGRAGSIANPRECKARITFARAPVLRKSPYAGMLFNGAGRPLKSDGFASTLPASMGGNKTPIVDEAEIFEGAPSFVEAYHKRLLEGKDPRIGQAPKRLRRLTIDECLVFQTFPSNYCLAGRSSSIFRQIGNAVPCNLAQAVGNVVRKLLAESDLSLLYTDVSRFDRAA
ncbi:DNA cytosine methyltransferase [Sulfitobacter noctilucae]|uniref:DNA cytosine methyltransferase n=1 Tax=Sulfitobacter noctilucae TaxID=1342302 RepID=UPI001268C297|nr:DNA (cytosine-5-)-methyltransferase [Sulfitobacter noctilucae]